MEFIIGENRAEREIRSQSYAASKPRMIQDPLSRTIDVDLIASRGPLNTRVKFCADTQDSLSLSLSFSSLLQAKQADD